MNKQNTYYGSLKAILFPSTSRLPTFRNARGVLHFLGKSELCGCPYSDPKVQSKGVTRVFRVKNHGGFMYKKNTRLTCIISNSENNGNAM